MNDDELITILREQRDRVRMTTPVEEVIGRGRAVRARHRVRAAGAALAAAAAVAVGVALPASHPTSGAPVHLAAWTVTRQANGSIKVTIRELRDPAGLQRTLRADGVPASVTFARRPNPACHGYGGGGDRRQREHRLKKVISPGHGPNILIIHPHGLPPGGGLQITSNIRHTPEGRRLNGFSLRLLKASPACTG